MTPSTAGRSAPAAGGAAHGPLSRHRLCDFSERTGYGTPAFAARGMEITPGWEPVELTMDPSGLVDARIGACPHGQGLRTTLAQIIADELGVAPRRSVSCMATPTARLMAGAPSPAARWSSPAARRCWRRARSAAADRHRQPLLEAAPDDIVMEDCAAKSPAPTPVPIARWRAPPIISPPLQGRISRARAKAPTTIRPARSRTPAMSPSSRSISRPAACGSSATWSPRMPAG